MGTYATLFAQVYAPALWQSEVVMFGRDVAYTCKGAGPVTLTCIWKEGAEDEVTSPGRYSNITIQLSDLLPSSPRKGDSVDADGKSYSVENVAATAIGYSRCLLKERL